jgi:hypothetical protein
MNRYFWKVQRSGKVEIKIESKELALFTKSDLKLLGWTADWTDHGTRFGFECDSLELTLPQLDLLASKGLNRKANSSIAMAKKVLTNKSVVATSAESMVELMRCYIAREAPGFRLYQRIGDRWFGYFVDAIHYQPEDKRSGYYEPAKCVVRLEYASLGELRRESFEFPSGTCRGRKPETVLAGEDLYVETEEIRQEYLASRKAYVRLLPQTGLQCKTGSIGFGISRYDDDRCVFSMDDKSKLDVRGKPVNVVIDCPVDDDQSIANGKGYTLSNLSVDNYYFRRLRSRLATGNATLESKEDIDEIDDVGKWTPEQTDQNEYALAPIHPVIPVFDLVRNKRYGVHSLDLEVYRYNKEIGEKLVLPSEHKRLLELLAKTDGSEFRDIIEGKSGGTTVLLAGKPGLGKTLSAEVFAEVTERPLYRVQCSQIGVDPDDIEKELTAVFGRALRWKAIILLDEADLYISKRGTDLDRNAIVCVFLRVLEYQSSVLFLTTNMPETVDDAIASRCIARIDMTHPERDSLIRIWNVLAESSGTKIGQEAIESLATEFSKMGGRDVKQALKLAMVNGGEITLDSLKFVLKFHPNRGEWL